MSPESRNEAAEKHHTESMMAKISERAKKASSKVAEKAQVYVQSARQKTDIREGYSSAIEDVKYDFAILQKDPKSEYFSGMFDDWTSKEIEELYEVLYGKKMGAQKIETAERQEITETEYAQACKNTKRSGDLIRERLKLGALETEVKIFAFGCLEKNIRAGYGLETLRSLAKKGGVLTEVEVDKLFAEINAKMLTETPTETEEEKEQREAKELEEMLKLYE